MNELEQKIATDLQEELYRRGYGHERFGSMDISNDWLALLLVFAVVYLIWS